MPTPNHLKATFYFNSSYHLVFKSIDGLLLFKDAKDFEIFKLRFYRFLHKFIHILSYSLLDNHVHFVIKTKSLNEILIALNNISEEDKTEAMKTFLMDINSEENFNGILERQINSFMVSYVKFTINKYKKQGGLFQKPFKRIKIEDEVHLQHAIIYTNANAQHHILVNDFKKHSQNSYLDFLNNDSSFISCQEILKIFGSIENYIQFHKKQVDYYYKNNWPSSKLE